MHANDIPQTLCPILSHSFTASPACGFPSGSSVVIQLFSRALNTSSHHKICHMQPLYPSCRVRELVHFDPSGTNKYLGESAGAILIMALQWELWGDSERFLIFVFAYAARQSIIHSIPSNICALRPGLRALFFRKRGAERNLTFWRTGVPPAPANFTAVIRSGF
ncbi:hypothetical protein B0H10DRAFT_1944741 [Mycena sp. CBHHK59/15]|nr:hypothetical protein B0H10DRAFT_1944741 [Mycena sp. CBHHK59/15]